MKKTTRIAALLLIACTLLTSCASTASVVLDNESSYAAGEATSVPSAPSTSTATVNTAENLSATTENELLSERGTYNEGVVLVKYEGEDESVFAELGVESAEPLYSGSAWYVLTLNEGASTEEAVQELSELGVFEKVDYDYIMGVTAETESVDVSGNPASGKQNDTFKPHHIKEGWDYLKKNGYNPGGSSDVVVAVIDTGVDYTHIDLRNNIWVNSAEIPDNGKDDDGNGYIDDLCGWNCVGDNKNPMDDNGHGTHVAGIIAAEDNKEGGVGVAYNCKVMVLKAGNSSGYFNNSDIAEAIEYAYMNGADVINMSFGGANISIAVEEALENAYNTSILVAAAGNSGKCNQPGCVYHIAQQPTPFYPAALSYVIGVMSTEKDGKHLSSFSNFDHYPYNSIEYEVYAVGEGVYSTWPSNKYATLNGTSMAAPMVSGIAALLRSYYTDREMYSTKFIQSQIVNTVEGDKITVNLHNALSKSPKPAVNLYDYYIDDSTEINTNNNGNGVIDAGETVRLYISLHNRGGVASNVNVSIDTYRREIGDETMTDPYFTFVNNTIQLSDIGTYSVRESGDKYFEIVVSGDCPNDYLVDFNIRYTYENGMDEKDNDTYSGDGVAQFCVNRGFYLPAIIDEDKVYTADRLYIVNEDVRITEGTIVIFEEGCQIQFYADGEYYDSPVIMNYGTLVLSGSSNNAIRIFPSNEYRYFSCCIRNFEDATCSLEYVEATNLSLWYGSINNSKLFTEYDPKNGHVHCYSGGVLGNVAVGSIHQGIINADTVANSYIEVNYRLKAKKIYGNLIIQNSSLSFETEISTTEGALFENNIWISAAMQSKSADNTGLTHSNLYNTAIPSATIVNNRIITLDNVDQKHLVELKFTSGDVIRNNEFSDLFKKNASQVIYNYFDSTGNATIDIHDSIADASLLWPYVVSVEMFDKDANPITTVGKEEIKVRVTFNRPMDVNAGTFLTFGTIEPYGDYRIDGEYISDTVWEGTYTLKAQIENGQNFLQVKNAWAAEDQTKTVFGEYQLHEFTIDTTAAMSMNLIANPLENGIELNFVQDDYDTLLGYNVYRSTEKDGNYVKLNPAIILPDELTFLDENAEPGKTYWYTYTVVLTDFTESNPAGKVQATAMDTIAPRLYHTPVNQGYMNNNLVITCTASDNVGIQSVVLYYRTVGATEWKTLSMVKKNDKFSAKIYGNELSLDGLEYYIVAYDENNSIAKGSADAPYTVVIKDASAISRKGDVDGDGVVTTKDALMLMQCINGDLILSDDEFKRADLNGDGVLNSMEALKILQYINGKINTLEM